MRTYAAALTFFPRVLNAYTFAETIPPPPALHAYVLYWWLLSIRTLLHTSVRLILE